MSVGKARVLAQSAVIKVVEPSTGLPIFIGEIDNFNVTSRTSLLTFRPIGTSLETPQLKYGGFDMKFSGGKVDWHLANVLHAQDTILIVNGMSPTFRVETTTTHYDGTKETFLYENVVIFGYDLNMQTGNEIGESFSGFATQRQQFGLETLANQTGLLLNTSIKTGIEELASFIASDLGFI